MKSRSAEQWLKEAYDTAPECPPPEVFLPEVLEEMSPVERRKLEEHADRCPACDAERTLAAEFDPRPERLDTAGQDLDYVVRKLRSPVAVAESPGNSRGTASVVVPIRRRNVWTWSLAAAAIFAFVLLGLVFTLEPSAPSLPHRTGEGVLRGTTLEIVQPLGDLDAMPIELSWEEVADAVSYRVHLLEVDGKALFEAQVSSGSVKLPPEIRSAMHAAVVYSWEAEALDAQGGIVARSERVEFRVRPGAFE